MKPFVGDVESFVLVGPDAEAVRCSRDENAELFRLAIGGYGLFGCIYSVRLRLVARRTLERVVEVSADRRDWRSSSRRGSAMASCTATSSSRPTPRPTTSCAAASSRATGRSSARGRRRPTSARSRRTTGSGCSTSLTRTSRRRAKQYSTHYLATSGQLYYSDAHQFADYKDGYHAGLDERMGVESPSTEMISELYVPRDRLADFMAAVADDFRAHDVNFIYGTIRLIERDDESFLAWATDRWAAIIFNLCTLHTPAGIERSAEAFRRLIDLAIERGGKYYLTYQRWTRRDQVEASYPQFVEFLRRKREYDPDGRFESDWYRHYRDMFAGRARRGRLTVSSRPLAAAAQPARFVLVGLGGYVVNLGVFALLHSAGVPYVANSIVSYSIANALMYLGNRYFTFRLGNEGFWAAYLRYLLVGVLVAVLNAALLTLIVEGTGIDSRVGVAISLLLVTPVAYVLFKRWTFKIKPA